jgi:FtsP/CotA-like multicopper oxidase with cupredoxin domain
LAGGATATVFVLDRVFAAEPRGFDVALEGGRLASGPKVIRVSEGETVEIRWTTDAPAEIHLHGYDIETWVAPGAPATMAFEAFATGRFPITLHGSDGRGHAHGTPLYLEVLPR